MKNKALQAFESLKRVSKSKSFVAATLTAVSTVSANAQGTAPADLVTFTTELADKAADIGAGLPAAGLAGLALFAIWYGIVMVMKVFKTVA